MKCQECKYCRSIGEGFTNFSTFEHYGEINQGAIPAPCGLGSSHGLVSCRRAR